MILSLYAFCPQRSIAGISAIDRPRPISCDLITDLGLKGDRVAVEHNGNIVPRAEWANTSLEDGDRLEIVHFVGGGRAG